MPVDAIKSLEDQLDRVVRHVNPKRIAMEMRSADKAFHFRYFQGLRPEKIGRGRIKKVLKKSVVDAEEGHELFANLIILHWNQVQGRLYQDMVTHVQTINEDVEAIERIDDDKAHAIIDDLLARYDREDILICVRFNGVRFDEGVIESRLIAGEPAPAEAAIGEGQAGEQDPDDNTTASH